MSESFLPIDPTKLLALREEHIGRLFLRAHRAFSERALQKLKARGHSRLNLAHTALLAHLDIQGTHITTLADRAGMTRQSMGQLARELTERGYVKRTGDENDHRAIIIQFTEIGWSFLEDAFAVKQEIEAEYAVIISEEQLQVLHSLLQKIVAE